jgi:hypothetical protein
MPSLAASLRRSALRRLSLGPAVLPAALAIASNGCGNHIDSSGRVLTKETPSHNARPAVPGGIPKVPVDGVAGEPLLRPDDYAA